MFEPFIINIFFFQVRQLETRSNMFLSVSSYLSFVCSPSQNVGHGFHPGVLWVAA